MAMRPVRYTIRVKHLGVPGKAGRESTMTVEATPKEIARRAPALIREGYGEVQSVTVSDGADALMRCDYSLRIRSARSVNAKRRDLASKSFARCTMTPGFKQLVQSKRRVPRRTPRR